MKNIYITAACTAIVLLLAQNTVAQSAEQIDLAMVYSYPAGSLTPDGDLKVQFKAVSGADFATNPHNIWNNTVFTIAWPLALGDSAMGTVASNSAMSFTKFGAPQSDTAYYYQVIGAASSNVVQSIAVGGILDVITMDIRVPLTELPNFQLINNDFTKNTIYGEASINNVFGEQFKTFNPASVQPIPLPVSYLSFDVNVIENKTVQLNWATASEVNNDHYIIERTADTNKEWAQIGKVNGNGTTNEAHNYTFMDYEPMLGTQYYRLRQMDFDGKINTNQPKSATIVLLGNNTTIKISPNPASDVINITISDGLAAATLYIYDMYGKMVYNAEFENTVGSPIKQNIDIAALAAGVYFIKTEIDGQKMENIRFIKN